MIATGIKFRVTLIGRAQGAVLRREMVQQRRAAEFIQACAETGHEVMVHVLRVHRHVHHIQNRLLGLRFDGTLCDIAPMSVIKYHHVPGTVELCCPASTGKHIELAVRTTTQTIRDIILRTIGLIGHLLTCNRFTDYTVCAACRPNVAFGIRIALAFIRVTRNAVCKRFIFPAPEINNIVFGVRAI